MANKKVYVERREEGDYAVRKAGSGRASAVEPTQEKAIERAKEMNPGVKIHVERVRNTSKGSPDKWKFEYYAKPFQEPEFYRSYDAEKGIEKFDNFIQMIRW